MNENIDKFVNYCDDMKIPLTMVGLKMNKPKLVLGVLALDAGYKYMKDKKEKEEEESKPTIYPRVNPNFIPMIDNNIDNIYRAVYVVIKKYGNNIKVPEYEKWVLGLRYSIGYIGKNGEKYYRVTIVDKNKCCGDGKWEVLLRTSDYTIAQIKFK